MSATRPTPETDAATFWGRDMGGDKGPPHFECVDADVARKLERERDELANKLVSNEAYQAALLADIEAMKNQHMERCRVLGERNAQWMSKAMRIMDQKNALRSAFMAAKAFIDSHVADPDLTAEMVETYAAYQEALAKNKPLLS